MVFVRARRRGARYGVHGIRTCASGFQRTRSQRRNRGTRRGHLHFTEPLEPAFSKIALNDANGKAAAPAASEVDKHDARVMHLPLPQLGAGRYAVHWTAVATDGHRTQGDFAFIVK